MGALRLAVALAAAATALLRGGARGAAVNGTARHFIASDLRGAWALLVRQGACPARVLHERFAAGPRGSLSVPHAAIAHDGARCAGAGGLAVGAAGAGGGGAGAGALDAVLRERRLAPTLRALAAQGATVLVGAEPAGRRCVRSAFAPGTALLFVEENAPVQVPGLITLFPGRKYMVVYDPASPVPCTYYARSSDRPVALPAPSPKPLHAKPAPPGARPPSPDPTAPPAPPPGAPSNETAAARPPALGGPGYRPDRGAAGTGADGALAPATSGGASACFPGDAEVALPGGARKRMDAVTVGDRVQVGRKAFSEVFMFTHRDAAGAAAFVRIETRSGEALRLTPAHYLYVNGRLAAAATVRCGDAVLLASGRVAVVASAREVAGRGVYNPQTLHGDIVVDGVVASTYTASVAPRAAHSLLAPFRALFRLAGLSAVSLLSGSRALAAVVPKGALGL